MQLSKMTHEELVALVKEQSKEIKALKDTIMVVDIRNLRQARSKRK